MSETEPPSTTSTATSPIPYPTPTIAKESFEAFWSEVRAAMARHNVPHLVAAVAAGAFPEMRTVGQGKDHQHELKVITSTCCAGNDAKLQGCLAAILLRSIINDEHDEIEKRYQQLVCGPKRDKRRKKSTTSTENRQ